VTARRAAGVALSLLVYAAAVLGRWQAASARADALGCALPRAVEDQLVVFAGLILGLVLGPALTGSARSLLRGLLPEAGEGGRLAVLRGAAAVALLVTLASALLWVRPGLDRFLDLHRPLLVEADLLLYGMGVVDGAAWHALLDRDAWLGLLLVPAMALMVLSGGVVGRGWC
jgi:hypothetical protein